MQPLNTSISSNLIKTIAITIGLLLFISTVIILPDYNIEYLTLLFLTFPGIDKPIHYSEHIFFFLIIYYFCYRILKLRNRNISIGITLTICFIISFIDELHQINIAGRSFEYDDLIINIAGIFTGFIIINFRKLKSFASKFIILIPLSIALYLTYNSYHDQNHYKQGIIFEKEGKFQLAKEQYLKAIELGVNNPGIYNSLAWLELEFLNNDPESSYKLTQHAVSLSPNNADYLDTHGWALYHLKRYDEALIVFNKAYQLNPEIYCIHYHLGMTYSSIGDIDLARVHFSRQIESDRSERYTILSKMMVDKISNAK